jgi:DHA1 family bicyclomycin/chloramphenicol resistance-like MFS transporter
MKPRHLIFLLAALSMLGAISIDAYLPALPAIAKSFSISLAAAQQTLTVYLFSFAFMTLFYGTLSDSFGRRPVIIVSLILYLLSSLGAIWSPSIGWLLLFRLMQGLSAGAGSVVGRAMIGDLFSGAEAQRMMSFISVVFGLAPAVAPILGGWLQAAFGWRSIFVFITVFTVTLLLVCARVLPETLPVAKRHPFHFKRIVSHYWNVGCHARFVAKCVSNALSFSGVLIYIGSAPVFVMTILHLSVKDFGWLFIPLIGGMTLGSILSARLSHHLHPRTSIYAGFFLMWAAAVANLIYATLFTAAIPWAVIPSFFYCIGMSFASPPVIVTTLEMFPETRGMAASLMSFTFMIVFAVGSGLVCPLLFGSDFNLAAGVLAGLALSTLFWWLGLSPGEDVKAETHVPAPEEIPVEL